jgi:hypothetical protein
LRRCIMKLMAGKAVVFADVGNGYFLLRFMPSPILNGH